MAHRAVGAGQSIALAGAAATATFKVQSSVMRVVAKGAPAFVAIGTEPTATTSDYYVPAGGTATLALTKSDSLASFWHERAAFQSVGVRAVDWQ